jgi:hypothetical protein
MSNSNKNDSVIILSRADILSFRGDVSQTITKANALLEDHFSKRVEYTGFVVKCLCELLLSAYTLKEYLDILFPDEKREYEAPPQDLLKLTKVAAVMQEIRNDLVHQNISVAVH